VELDSNCSMHMSYSYSTGVRPHVPVGLESIFLRLGFGLWTRLHHSIFGNSQTLDELVELKLHGSFCLSLLQYSFCIVKLSFHLYDIVSSCWNMTFIHRPIFKFHKFDYVSAVVVSEESISNIYVLCYYKIG